ncbi:MAG: hypothetical protein JWN67_1207 [Actinomycetia bacterium]|nr:hypothetical protein [Actinomycetes bacterium]
MRRRSPRVLVAMLVVGLALVAGPVTMALAQTADDSALGVFDVSADASGVGVSFGDPNTQPYPTAAGLVPSTTAQLGSGPAGHALASMVWPGPLAANAGTLATLIGAPLPPEVLNNANYPVRAEARSSGDRDEQTVGPMSAVVDGGESTARTAFTDFDAPNVVSAARVVTRSRSYLEGSAVTSVAETELGGVEIGGLIKIDAIRTVARGTTDGAQATMAHEVTVSGVTVQGQGATIDQDGLHLGPQTSENPLTPVAAGANQALAGAGMEAFVTKPSEYRSAGGNGLVSSGSVVFTWKLDATNRITVVLGGASASLSATPGSAFGLSTGDLGGFGPVGGAGGELVSPGALPAVDAGAPSIASPGSSSGGGTDVITPVGFTSSSPVSDRVPMGWMLIGLVGMALVGSSLHGLRAKAIDAALVGSTCPLERGAS